MKFAIFGALATTAVLSACAVTGPATGTGVEPGTDAVVEMLPILRFSPEPLTISVGDTVEFQNVSAFTHTVSTRPADAAEAADTALPPGAESFDSGDIAGGEVYRQTFTVPGTYKYFCDPHHGAGMKGTIIVSG